MDNTAQITALGILVVVSIGLVGWALMQNVVQGNRITALETKSENTERRLTEIIQKLNELQETINGYFRHRRTGD